MVSFDNTAIAFADRTDAELRRAEMLFRLVGSPALVGFGKSALELALALRLPVSGIVRATVFQQFCGGESVADCEPTIERLHAAGIYTLLDYSAEGKNTEADFDASAKETISTILRGRDDARIPFAVFKCTGVVRASLLERVSAGNRLEPHQAAEWESGLRRVRSICEAAATNRVPVLVDAEESWLQPAIDEMVERMMAEFNREEAMVYNTFQLYRTDRLDYLRRSLEVAERNGYFLGAKLVRGAYMEKERERAKRKGHPSPIHRTKTDTDAAYDAAQAFCVAHADRIRMVSGTHNESSSRLLTELMHDAGLAADDRRIFFSQLYGMSDNISFNLAHAGHNVVKYVPYGPVRLVMPYLMRRAEENTSVTGQVGRELSLILKEKQRRRARQ
jgi:proline dehydrogenase